MTDDPTKDLTESEKLNRILAELSDMKARLTALEAQGEERANTTRPLLDRLIQEMVQMRDALTERLEKVEREIRLFSRKMDIFNEELLQLRHGHREPDARLSELERRPN